MCLIHNNYINDMRMWYLCDFVEQHGINKRRIKVTQPASIHYYKYAIWLEQTTCLFRLNDDYLCRLYNDYLSRLHDDYSWKSNTLVYRIKYKYKTKWQPELFKIITVYSYFHQSGWFSLVEKVAICLNFVVSKCYRLVNNINLSGLQSAQ